MTTVFTLSAQTVILQALRYLAARCDGAVEEDGRGFNKPDSYRGKQLADYEFLDSEDVAEAYAILRKYQASQLSAARIVLPDIKIAQAEADEVEQTRGAISIDGDCLIVKFPYSFRHVATVKTVKGARYVNGESKSWTVPIASGKQLLAAFPKFAISEADKGAILDWKADGPTYAGKITLDGDQLIVSFEYDAALVAKVKAIAGAKFDGTRKVWRVPFSQAKATIEAMANFQVTPEVTEKIRAAAQAAAADTALTAELLTRLDQALPSGRTLFEHQKAGVRFLVEKRRAILADDMGLGKSLTSLVAAKAYKLPVIVICPASLQLNWKREAALAGVDITVHSWAKIPKAPPVDFVLIADEAHYAQSLKSARTKAMLALSKDEHCRGAILLTGTPIKNGRPVNLYPLLLAARHWLAENKSQYEYYYCAAHATRFSKWDTSGAAHLDELHKNTRDVMLRRMKKDCLDLPEKTRVIRAVELSSAGQKAYDERFKALRDEYRQRIIDGKISSEAEAIVMLNHVRHAGSQAKTETAIELAQEVIEEGGQVVVFVAFHEPGEVIARALGVKLFSGDTDVKDRQAMVDRFQAGTDKAFVCTLGAGGVGITLTAAQTVILVDRPWTPGDAEQAEDRLHRIGQKNAVTAVWLQYGDTDAAIDAILESKKERIDLVLQGKRKTMRGTGSTGQIAQELLPNILG